MDSKTPRPYQRAGIEFLSSRPGALLGDQVGLGKTLEAIFAAIRVKATSCLVVAPKNLKHWWQEEITTIELQEGGPGAHTTVEDLGPGLLTLQVFGGPGFEENRIRTWVLSHYEQFVDRRAPGGGEKVIESPLKAILLGAEWDVVIVDEVHKIKNRKAKRTASIKKVQSKWRWGLSGTLVAERPDDLWAPLNFVAEKHFKRYWEFASKYVQTSQGRWGGVEYLGCKNLPGLTRETAPFILIRTRADVGIQLPPLQVVDVPLLMEGDQWAFYKEVERKLIVELTEDIPGLEGSGLTLTDLWDLGLEAVSGQKMHLIINSAIARFTRLHQVASGPTVLKEGVSNVKVGWLNDYAEGGGEPAVIMSRYLHSVNAVNAALERVEKGLSERYKVGTYSSLSHGHNLQMYHIFIAWDMPYSLLEWTQAVGRIERPGQLHPMTVYRLMAEASVDWDVREIVEKKGSNADLVTAWLRRVENEAQGIHYGRDLGTKGRQSSGARGPSKPVRWSTYAR